MLECTTSKGMPPGASRTQPQPPDSPIASPDRVGAAAAAGGLIPPIRCVVEPALQIRERPESQQGFGQLSSCSEELPDAVFALLGHATANLAQQRQHDTGLAAGFPTSFPTSFPSFPAGLSAGLRNSLD